MKETNQNIIVERCLKKRPMTTW